MEPVGGGKELVGIFTSLEESDEALELRGTRLHRAHDVYGDDGGRRAPSAIWYSCWS